jgi:predicted regulator of Ras-like GTPase activity (Roadblock/LC7/MglB family)
VDVAQALADLTEISSQIEAAVVFSADGTVAGSTLADESAAAALARAAAQLLDRANAVHADRDVTQIEAALAGGAVFVVRGDDDRRIAATTVANPTVGLVFYDLKSCLRDSQPEEQPRRRTRKKETEA